MKNQPHWLCGVVGIFLQRLYYLLHGQILLLMSGFAWPIGNLASQFISARKFNRKIFPWADLDPGRIKQNNSGQEGFSFTSSWATMGKGLLTLAPLDEMSPPQNPQNVLWAQCITALSNFFFINCLADILISMIKKCVHELMADESLIHQTSVGVLK